MENFIQKAIAVAFFLGACYFAVSENQGLIAAATVFTVFGIYVYFYVQDKKNDR
jgi:hypothetical protein